MMMGKFVIHQYVISTDERNLKLVLAMIYFSQFFKALTWGAPHATYSNTFSTGPSHTIKQCLTAPNLMSLLLRQQIHHKKARRLIFYFIDYKAMFKKWWQVLSFSIFVKNQLSFINQVNLFSLTPNFQRTSSVAIGINSH